MINFFFFVKNVEGLTPLIKTWTPPKEVKNSRLVGVETCILLTCNLNYNTFPIFMP